MIRLVARCVLFLCLEFLVQGIQCLVIITAIPSSLPLQSTNITLEICIHFGNLLFVIICQLKELIFEFFDHSFEALIIASKVVFRLLSKCAHNFLSLLICNFFYKWFYVITYVANQLSFGGRIKGTNNWLTTFDTRCSMRIVYITTLVSSSIKIISTIVIGLVIMVLESLWRFYSFL